MYRGALIHLRYTRSLSLYDVDEQGALAKETEAVRQEDILRVIHLFPDNRLSSFRYVSGVHD
jgi:hypothetical protein